MWARMATAEQAEAPAQVEALPPYRDAVTPTCAYRRYPPTGNADAERGCGAHTDCGFLTFVCQDAPGIEVCWITAAL